MLRLKTENGDSGDCLRFVVSVLYGDIHESKIWVFGQDALREFE